ncbi:MAG: putative rane protein [Firmicutes bacterium]|nr:putative rane protein [Bacillota bacterium]
MMPLLVFRERVKSFYQRHDIYINPAVKFIFALISFMAINGEIGYDSRIKAFPVVLAFALVSAFTPSSIMVLIATAMAALHVYYASPILSILVIILLMILYFLFARFTPKYGYVVLAIPILFFLKIPYVIPILLGIIATPVAIVSTVCGVVVYYIIQLVKTAVNVQVNPSVDDVLKLYTDVIDGLMNNKQMIMTIVIFALILLVVYYVRRMKFDYAFEISIAAGALTSILGFLISDIILDKSDQILAMILGTIISGVIVYLVHFFKLTLDYSGVEHAQFEDDVYYYYVKAVPKVTITTPQRKVKHINVKNTSHEAVKSGRHVTDTDEEEYDEDEDAYSDNDNIEDFDYNNTTKADRKNGMNK